MARHRTFVGPLNRYDLIAGSTFSLLYSLGLRESHSLLDIGCGSLRVGRLLITYLLPDLYCGIEPNTWLIDEGIQFETGQDLIDLKRPLFNNSATFGLSVFGRTFDWIVAHSIFSHAAPAQIKNCLNEAKLVLNPGGTFIATFCRGNRNYTGETWRYPAIVRYTLEYMAELADAEGLACMPLEWLTPNRQIWLRFTHKDVSDENL